MKKKNILILSLIIILIVVHILFRNYNYTKYEVITDDEWNQIINEREESEESLISGLAFNEYDLIKDNNGIYYYSLIENNKKAYIPFVKNISGIIIKFHQNITDEMIKNNEYLDVLTYNDSYYRIEHVVLTKLPLLKISYDISAKMTDVDKVDMSMYLYDNRENINSRVVTSTGTIHYRGYTSLAYPKKGYRINLTKNSNNFVSGNNVSLLGMRKDNDWILNSLYSDGEKIRNVFASQLWYDCCSMSNQFDIVNGVEYKYVELFINNEYSGLYALGYPVDGKTVGLKKNDDNEYVEYLFKKRGWSGVEQKFSSNDDNDILYKYYIKTDTNDMTSAYGILKKLYVNIFSSENVEDIAKNADMANYIDAYLYFNLIQGIDNVSMNDLDINNAYVSLKKDNDTYKLLITPWDMDQTFGNKLDPTYKNFIRQYNIKVSYNHFMRLSPVSRLLELDDSDIKNKLVTRYNELRYSYWSEEYINKLLDKYEENIYGSGAFIRDKEKWPDGTYNNASDGLSIFREYVLNRLEYSDASIERIIK